METEVKVFHSEISRVDCDEENNLYDLLNIEPAKPVSQSSLCTKNETWEFVPKEKLYSPKRVPSKLKSKAVSDVRALFEKDVYTYLASDLEIQQKFLLRKICDGSSSENKTRKTAVTILNGDTPISRSSWQMLSNINPERHKHTKQFVLWNGRCIQVNGSKGGKNKFMCNHDLKKIFKKPLKNTSHFQKSLLKSRIGLLRNSLNVKFKPGPLGKKKFLDDSHHKYQMGDIELVKLPAPALEVSPAYGVALEPSISSFVNSLRGEEGIIPPKLAELAVSVLGKARNNAVSQLDGNYCLTFDLSYKCQQNRILMRRNVVQIETTPYTNHENDLSNNKNIETKPIHSFHNNISFTDSNAYLRADEGGFSEPDNPDESIFEVKQIMNEILDSVNISLNQDTMYSEEDEPREITSDNSKDFVTSKDKQKRKYFELDKLDVTIIELAKNSKKDYTKPCDKSFCTMGCVCESLDSTFSLKQHCGVLDCMFGCKCDISKYKNIEFLKQDCSDLIPGLLNLDNELNSHMAKEEQKFHQTVIFSGEKSILLKSRKRNCKSSKRYEEFYNKKNIKSAENIKRVLSIDIEKLNCENIEPLCMVHNLYKCFCKLKFTETYVRNDTFVNTNKPSSGEISKVQLEVNTNKFLDNQNTKDDSDSRVRNALRPRPRKTYGKAGSGDSRKCSSNTEDDDELSVACARTMGYYGRKYTNDYYLTTNKKIIEMEQNDSILKNKMMRLINGKRISTTSETIDMSSESLDCDTIANEEVDINYARLSIFGSYQILHKAGENNMNISSKTENKMGDNLEDPQPIPCKGSLKSWFESSYKSYKERLEKGVFKNCLVAPKKGKAALQSWDFILSRYRDRKNIFVVSKQEPFRTFLAVNDNHPFIANCINIDDIRFADLQNYPVIVRNLVTNATDSENAFCILRGWDHCWELIGAAVKVFEKPTGSLTQDIDFMNTDNLVTKDYTSDDGNDGRIDNSFGIVPAQEGIEFRAEQEDIECSEVDTTSEKSKWFVLTVENDFTEIQFYKKGFYVTYEGIQRSINLARISGKTVRLSSRARTDTTQNSTTHPYGIYAIPCNVQCCVFIGPYEEHEPLGIEVVKSVLDSKRLKKTRGVWINTNKVDNKNVIDNPLAYLPSASKQNENIPIASIDISKDTIPLKNTQQEENSNKKTPEKELTLSKHVKPIKIRRTNGFYHLSSKNILKKIAKQNMFVNINSVVNKSLLKPVEVKQVSKQPVKKVVLQSKVEKSRPIISLAQTKPIAEIAPQIMITNVYSERKSPDRSATDRGSAMLVLKPEEINKKVLDNSGVVDEFGTDVEKFLETSTICIAPQEEVLLISDGEEDVATSTDIWIQCSNVEGFGYVRAKINDNAGISFEFPGFKYSEFYEEKETFDKINQVLARKLYVPRNVKLQWQVIRDKQCLTCDMLTPKCLEDKKYLLNKLRVQQEKKSSLVKAFTTTKPKNKNKGVPKSLLKAETSENLVTYVYQKTSNKSSPNRDVVSADKNEQMKLIEGLEEASRKLEQQSALLWKEAVTRRDEIFSSLSVPDNMKLEMTEALEDIMSDSRDLRWPE